MFDILKEVPAERIKWDTIGKRIYHYGVSKGVLFVQNLDGTYANGVGFDGLRNVNDTPDGGEVTKYYADNIEYFQMEQKTNWRGSIGCYDTPKEFDICVGEQEIAPGFYASQQPKRRFAFCYREEIGSDTTSKKGYVLHIVYGAMASASQQDHPTVNENTEPSELNYDFDCTPVIQKIGDVEIETAHVKISSLDPTAAAKLSIIEDKLYGKDPVEGESPVAGEAPTLLMPTEIANILNATSNIKKVTEFVKPQNNFNTKK